MNGMCAFENVGCCAMEEDRHYNESNHIFGKDSRETVDIYANTTNNLKSKLS